MGTWPFHPSWPQVGTGHKDTRKLWVPPRRSGCATTSGVVLVHAVAVVAAEPEVQVERIVERFPSGGKVTKLF